MRVVLGVPRYSVSLGRSPPSAYFISALNVLPSSIMRSVQTLMVFEALR